MRVGRCFNEAAGIPRGRRPERPTNGYCSCCFNEAAGIPRGRREWNLNHKVIQLLASMRPRVFPAEDLPPPQRRPELLVASMRPRVFPAEDLLDAVTGVVTADELQ